MSKFETQVVTLEVDATDVRGKDTIAVLNEWGQQGWEPWQMFTSAASSAWKFPGINPGRVWLSIWLKRAVS